MHHRSCILALLAFTAGCDRATGNEDLPLGALSVGLSGSVNELFHAEGAVLQNSSNVATFAAAFASARVSGAYAIGGFHASGTKQDALTIDLRGVSAPGDYPIGGLLTLHESGGVVRNFALEQGTARITVLNEARLTGEFSAIGITYAGPLELPPDTVVLTSGTVDVPIVRQ